MRRTIFRILLALAVAATLAFASSAFAAEATFEERFQEMDTNGDTHVDHDEFIANYEGPDQEEAFKMIDKDQSHTVSVEEWIEYNESGGGMKKSE